MGSLLEATCDAFVVWTIAVAFSVVKLYQIFLFSSGVIGLIFYGFPVKATRNYLINFIATL